MKKKLVLASKVIVGIFLLLFFIILMDIGYTLEGESIEITAYVFIPCFLFGVLTLILFLIEFILEIKESWKEKGNRLVIELISQVAVILAAIAFYNVIILKEKNIKSYLVVSIGVVVLSKVLGYWKRIRKSEA